MATAYHPVILLLIHTLPICLALSKFLLQHSFDGKDILSCYSIYFVPRICLASSAVSFPALI
jgi:hypothetical protein